MGSPKQANIFREKTIEERAASLCFTCKMLFPSSSIDTRYVSISGELEKIL